MSNLRHAFEPRNIGEQSRRNFRHVGHQLLFHFGEHLSGTRLQHRFRRQGNVTDRPQHRRDVNFPRIPERDFLGDIIDHFA
jgi:hypothetical protein